MKYRLNSSVRPILCLCNRNYERRRFIKLFIIVQYSSFPFPFPASFSFGAVGPFRQPHLYRPKPQHLWGLWWLDEDSEGPRERSSPRIRCWLQSLGHPQSSTSSCEMQWSLQPWRTQWIIFHILLQLPELLPPAHQTAITSKEGSRT